MAETFAIPDDAKPVVRSVHKLIGEHMLAMTDLLKMAGLPEREARSYIANSVTNHAWRMVTRERKFAGEAPDPDRFIEMVKVHVQ